eukprot:scaffold2514_cov226-Alexandrium_tamarense.AAC.13
MVSKYIVHIGSEPSGAATAAAAAAAADTSTDPTNTNNGGNVSGNGKNHRFPAKFALRRTHRPRNHQEMDSVVAALGETIATSVKAILTKTQSIVSLTISR